MGDQYATLINPYIASYESGVWFRIRRCENDAKHGVMKWLVVGQNIDVYLVENGEVVFDFCTSTVAPALPLEPTQTSNQENAAARVKIMNLPRLCLRTSLYRSNIHVKTLEDRLDSLSSFRWMWNLQHEGKSPKSTRSFDVEHFENAMRLFDNVLNHEFRDLHKLVDLCDLSADLAAAARFGESISVSWTACERIINFLMDRQVGFQRTQKKQSAAFKLNLLLSAGTLDSALHKRLDRAKDLRNDWLHEMNATSFSKANEVLVTAENLICTVFGVDMHLSLAGTRFSLPFMAIRRFAELNPGEVDRLGIDLENEPDCDDSHEVFGATFPIKVPPGLRGGFIIETGE